MDCKTTFTKPNRAAAFTLVEVMVASAVALIVVVVIALLSFYSSRSFVAMANYVSMDQQSQLALDRMSREIRQARGVTQFTPTSLTLQDTSDNLVQFVYDSDDQTLSRVSGSSREVYLANCDFLEFSNYQRTTISNTFDAYESAYVTNTRLIQVTWVCSRKILGAKANTESVQSAKITLRNN
jgi:type II secretory pathway pseudopilin PulG